MALKRGLLGILAEGFVGYASDFVGLLKPAPSAADLAAREVTAFELALSAYFVPPHSLGELGRQCARQLERSKFRPRLEVDRTLSLFAERLPEYTVFDLTIDIRESGGLEDLVSCAGGHVYEAAHCAYGVAPHPLHLAAVTYGLYPLATTVLDILERNAVNLR